MAIIFQGAKSLNTMKISIFKQYQKYSYCTLLPLVTAHVIPPAGIPLFGYN